MKPRAWTLLFLLSFSIESLAAESLSLSIDAFELEGIQAQGIVVSSAWIDSGHLDLTISVAQVLSSSYGQITGFRVHCTRAIYQEYRIVCEQGTLNSEHDSLGHIKGNLRFTYHLQQGLISMELSAILMDGGKIDITYDAIQENWQGSVVLEAIGMDRLQDMLASLLAGHELTSGTVDVTAGLGGHGGEIDTVSASIRASGLGIEGTNVFEGVELSSRLTGKKKDGDWNVSSDLLLAQGAMYLVPGVSVLGDTPGFYLEVKGEPVHVHTDLGWKAGGQIDITDLRINHPGQLHLQASAVIESLHEPVLDSLFLDASLPDLAGAYPIYIQPLLLQTNFSDLEVAGGVDLKINYAGDRLQRFELTLTDLFLDDRLGRFSLSGVAANLHLAEQDEPVTSSLRWDGMSLYRLDFGPGDIRLESSGKNVRVVDWQDVSILDGTLQIASLSLKNLGSADFELSLDGKLTPISMQAFTQAMDWPLFSGKISSAISGLKYAQNSMEIDGDIRINVFNGEVVLRGLQIWDILSSYSTLSTDIEVNNLDLEQLTDTFAFGKIEGSLSGRMDRLKLEDWQPVYFEAEFASPDDDDRPHRISQKALENLGEIGGGLGGTLSNGFLRIFPTYSYGAIGVSCRLSNGVCELGGVEETADGFYLLTRGGLLPPWVDVMGTGHSITWDDLIGGLKRIAKGDISVQ